MAGKKKEWAPSTTGATSRWRFNIPTLPKPAYQTLVSLVESYKLSMWQTVILGAYALQYIRANQPAQLNQMVVDVATAYPADWRWERPADDPGPQPTEPS